jgi:hypothetical protein
MFVYVRQEDAPMFFKTADENLIADHLKDHMKNGNTQESPAGNSKTTSQVRPVRSRTQRKMAQETSKFMKK